MTMTDNTMSTTQRTMGSLRKTNKPLMEKRRRARINDSLTQLKSLVIQGSKKDSSQFNKLEKADILELTVKHLRNLQDQQQLSQINKDASLVGKYQAGFMECANEVMRYLGQSQGFSDDTKSRVVQHLASCIQLSNNTSFTKPQPGNTVVTNSNIAPTTLSVSNGQLTNGQIIQIVNSQFPKNKSSNNCGFPGVQPISVASATPISSAPAYNPAAITSSATSTTLPEPQSYTKYTQPLQIQIPAVLSPVLVQTKTLHQNPSQPQVFHKVQKIAPQVIPHLTNPKQESLIFTNSPPPQSRETSISTLPLRISQQPQKYYTHEDQYSEFIPRSRTYSLTSSSSESEMSSPLNLSHSPQYYNHRDFNNNKYPSPSDNLYIQAPGQLDKNVGPHPKDGLFLSHCPPSSCTSVIVDGRRTVDGHAMRYMHFMEEDGHFIRHEGSTSPASSVGEERLWRPW